MTERLMDNNRTSELDFEEPQIKPNPIRQKRIVQFFLIGFIMLIISIIIFFLLRNRIKVLNDGKNINRPLIDTKEYIFYELTNKMKVALISDNKTKISGCSLSVTTGSFYDIIIGLALYSSKMILAGSEKYKNETDTFIDKIKEMEGENIITTLNNMTTYSFHVHNNGFIKVLDIFANILDQPRLALSEVDEDLEYHMSANVDNAESEFLASNNSKFLLKQIVKDLANKNHPYHNLTIGNYISLREKRKEGGKLSNYTTFLLSDVKSYFDTFYKTKNMTLVIYSNLTLAELKKEIIDKFAFDSHSSLSSETFLFKKKFEQLSEEPFSEKSLNVFALYKSNKWNSVYFSFYFSKPDPNIRIALEYFKFLFFSRANNTLIHSLMNKEIFEYTIDESDIGYRDFSVFSFRLHLHRNNTKDTFYKVINDVYEYIKSISQNVNKELYDNLKNINEYNFQTQENTKDIAKLTSGLSNKLFSGDYNNFLKRIVFPEYSEKLQQSITNTIKKMTKENSIIVAATYEDTIFNDLNQNMAKKKLVHYNLTYYYKQGIDKLLNENKSLIKNNVYEIRKVNQNIPNITKADLVKYEKSEYELTDSLQLFKIDKTEKYYESYFATERRLQIPKIEIVMNFYSPNYYPCKVEDNKYLIPTITMPFIIEALLKQYFSEYFEVANSFEVIRKLDYFDLKLILFNDKKKDNIKHLLQNLINTIFGDVDSQKNLQRIGRAKLRQLLIEYSQTGIDSVSKQSFEILKAIVADLYIQPNDLFNYLKNIDSFKPDYYSTFIKNVHLHVSIIGDVDQNKAKEYSEIIQNKVKEKHVDGHENDRIFKIANVSDNVVYYYYNRTNNPSENQNSISIFYQIGKNSFKKYIYTELFNICIGDIFINTLRNLSVTNIKTNLVLFNNILYYQITAYLNNNSNLYEVDERISIALNKSIHQEIDNYNDFKEEKNRIMHEGLSIYRTNLYEVTEKVISRSEAPDDYNHEDKLLDFEDKKFIKDYFTKKFIESPKRIGIFLFNYLSTNERIENQMKEFMNKTHILNKGIKNIVTSNFVEDKIPRDKYYQ